MKRRLKTLLGTELPMLAVLAFALGPWFWMLLSSLRPERDLTRTPLLIWPSTLTLSHHLELLEPWRFRRLTPFTGSVFEVEPPCAACF